ncbi:hypothetical protein SeMB42_g05504 [Synchytrium endobioticum]|uniref:AMP-dependent synthetase/ligase domain-containing protein n=1 Tax=Synchytrium endobioticum TaxID=286115 RepID=A0A507DBA6_9FUNG|nr:hypothetical protein SeMB42_g05504 [Synchytrium endobioticum]TPX48863.1 hypothetical protein SeLEV6574_g01796 [Synchytrium endobioticum]
MTLWRHQAKIARRVEDLFKAATQNQSKAAIVNPNGNTFTYGDRVAFLCPRSYEYVVAQWSSWMSGGIAVPLCDTHPSPELEYTINDSGASVVIVHKSLERIYKHIRPKFPLLQWKEVDDYAVEPPREFVNYDTVPFDGNNGALIVYTSGTTGQPKGCLTTHNNLEHQVLALIMAWKWTKDDKILHCLPLHHVHGIMAALTCALYSGATVEFVSKFEANAVWKRWRAPQRDLTLFMAVPTMYSKLTEAWRRSSEDDKKACVEACHQFRLMVSGSAALPVKQFEDWETISGHQLLERYGMSETGLVLSNPLNGVRRPGCVGTPLPFVDLKVVDDDGHDVTECPDVPGMLHLAGPMIYKEYWGRPDATRQSFRGIGGKPYFITGDIVQLTNDGVYRIMGRARSDIIKTGGYKVSALEVEQEILTVPGVSDVAVFAVPDEQWGDQVTALLVLKPGMRPFDLSWFRNYLKPRIASYKIPSQIKFIDELPRNAMLKINKKDLRDKFVQGKL